LELNTLIPELSGTWVRLKHIPEITAPKSQMKRWPAEFVFSKDPYRLLMDAEECVYNVIRKTAGVELLSEETLRTFSRKQEVDMSPLMFCKKGRLETRPETMAGPQGFEPRTSADVGARLGREQSVVT
jgi:hypothetical protein